MTFTSLGSNLGAVHGFPLAIDEWAINKFVATRLTHIDGWRGLTVVVGFFAKR